ncbi:MAG: hypothetical protein HUJ98_07940 [Bacteroidaceae bacterium]|nr:hypothetical protein [Bacteroidaceae bacterium]
MPKPGTGLENFQKIQFPFTTASGTGSTMCLIISLLRDIAVLMPLYAHVASAKPCLRMPWMMPRSLTHRSYGYGGLHRVLMPGFRLVSGHYAAPGRREDADLIQMVIIPSSHVWDFTRVFLIHSCP